MNIKNMVSFLLIAGLTSISIVSCKKNNLVIGKDYTPPTTVKFNRFLNTDTVTTYYIKSTNDPLKLAVGLTTVSSVDRTIQFTYASRTAVAGTQYTAPASIVIPAGKALDSLAISGLFSGYPTSSRIDTLDIYITGGDAPAGSYNAHHRLLLRKYCDVFQADLTGNFANSTDTYSGNASSKPNYTATVTDWTPISATSASIIIHNMGATSDNGWGPFGASDPSRNPGIKATIDWTNPAAFSVTIPTQNYFDDGSGMSTINATGTFSSCDQTYTITCKVKYAGNGSTYTHVSYLRR